jgi:hypothetical protein|tara:strand:+ start:316 stop:504 length:189 start_codon:yes stop_codon:yes gene_type:complete
MTSSWIKDWSYDADAENLTVELKSGKKYVYGDVPQEEADAMAQVHSLGTFHNTRLRDNYPVL